MSSNPFVQSEEATEKAEARAERHEAPKTPEQLANDYLIQGEQMTDELKAELEKARADAAARADTKSVEELNVLSHETEEAKEELNKNLKVGLPETTTKEEPLEPEQALEQAERSLYTQEAMADVTRIIDACGRSESLKQQVREAWTKELGAKAAGRLLEDPSYRESVMGLSRALQLPIREGGPTSLADANLKNTIIVHETLGAKAVELVRANDLAAYAPELGLDMEAEGVLLIPESSLDDETGEWEAKVEMSLAYRHADGQPAKINRLFTRRKLEDGEFEKLAEHAVFELPISLQENGIAAKALGASLKQYEAMGVDAIELNANINIGSYAWAQYGFDYAPGEHSEADIESMAQDYEGSLAAVIAQLDLETWEFSEETQGDVRVFKNKALGERLTTLLEQLKVSRTPQDTAIVGADGPFFCRDKESTWSMFESREEAKAYNDQLRKSGQEDTTYTGVMHAGKLALMNKLWRGRVELKQNGAQKGKNHALLKDALERRNK